MREKKEVMDGSYIIYGYSPTGEAAYHKLISLGKKVECFCEDSFVERESVSEGLSVHMYSLEEIVDKEIEGIFVICIASYKRIEEKLLKNGKDKWILAYDLLIDTNYKDFFYNTMEKGMAIRQIDACMREQGTKEDEDYLLIRNIDLEITERCSMRCRDCSNLMQYYQKPKDFSQYDIAEWMDNLLSCVDEINEVRVIGGEPFMNKHIGEIVEFLIKKHQIMYITIYSNATIMPSPRMWDIFSHDKVGFSITDYGDKSRRLKDIFQEIKKRNIAYDIHPSGKWTKCSLFLKHNRSNQENQKIYDDCCGKNLTSLLNGKIYKCPFMANAMNLQAIPQNKQDYIQLSDLVKMPQKEAKEMLRRYLNRNMYQSCDFCLGRSYQDESIEPAVQSNKPLPYRKV